MSRYAKLAENAFRKIQVNAGIIAKDFNVSTGAIAATDIIGATDGGINFTATPSYKDFGEGLDNCPKNTKELKRIESIEVKASGTFKTIDPALAQKNIGAADIDGNKITPRMTLKDSDFEDFWIIGDYSDDIAEETGGFIAIHMMDALSTGGFQLQTTDQDKGAFAFEYLAHYSIHNPDKVPYEIYVKEGDALIPMSVTSVAGANVGDTKITASGYTLGTGESYVYKTDSTVSMPDRGDSVASGWTAWNGTADITATSGNDIAIVAKDGNDKAIAGGKTKVVAKAGV